MPLYDAYGKLINTPDIPQPAVLSPQDKIRKAFQRWRVRFRSLKPFVRYTLEGLTIFGLILGIFWGVLALRQEILVEPYVSYDPKEAFQQQFTITNNGPFDVYDVHYSCAVSTALLENGFSPVPQKGIIEMIPLYKPHVARLHWKQKTNTECDFITLFGPQLKSANIEILVSYKRWLRKTEVETGQQFSGKRDAMGSFQWVYGSSDPSLLEPPGPNSPKKAVVMVPF